MLLLRTASVLSVLVTATPVVGQSVSAPQLKAAFIINFAKLATWPGLASTGSITLCTVGDDQLASTMATMVQGQRVNGHALIAMRPVSDVMWSSCQLLFLGRGGATRSSRPLEAAPDTLLTVSDEKGFASNGGMIELFTEDARLRFAVNLSQVDKSKVVLSSQLLQLARIVGDSRAR